MKPLLCSLLLSAIPCLSFSEVILRNGVLLDRSLDDQKGKPFGGQPLEIDPVGDEIVLFTNGDVMHGSFGGIEGGLLWERSDIDRPIRFGLPSVHQIVMARRPTLELTRDTSFVTLVSGDRIPGKIISLSKDELVMESPVLGELVIRRPLLRSIAPNPFDGELFYSGPYSSDGWVILDSEEATQDKENKNSEEEGEEPQDNSAWIHSGASFFNLGSEPLAFPEAGMPGVGRLSFRVEWKGRFSLTLAFLSDFTRPVTVSGDEKPEEEKEKKEEAGENGNPPAALDGDDEEDQKTPPRIEEERLTEIRRGRQFQAVPWINSASSNHALTFGSGYTMTLYSSYPSLSRNSFSDDGDPVIKRMSRTRSNVSLGEEGEAEIEIRYNREKGVILLYLNGEYASQWHDLEGGPTRGGGLGLLNNSPNSRLRISEVTITSWNGMKDTANSMKHPSRDVALLTNGTDRFSGDLTRIVDGIAHFETDYLEARIPVRDLSKIVFKGQSGTPGTIAPAGQPTWEEEPLTILYRPHGVIKLHPHSADSRSIQGTSPFLGEIEADLSAASLLRFTDGSPDLSDWFDDL